MLHIVVSVLSVAQVSSATYELPFGELTDMGPRNHVLDGVQTS